MFTGIIRDIGLVERLQRRDGVIRVTVSAPHLAAQVTPLESVSVNGACLSVVDVGHGTLAFEIIPETQRLTTLGGMAVGSQVNLEPSLRLTDRLSGHVVLGHVDGRGTIARRRTLSGELIYTIRIHPSLRRWLVPKGPVTIDGVSLTIGERVTPSAFTIHLIPETLRCTTLRRLKVGDQVNIEADYLAKLVAEQLRR